MRKSSIVWLITAVSLILLGTLLFSGALMALNFDFGKLSTTKYETNTHSITDEFHSISISTDTADVTLLPSEDGKASVVAAESEKMKHAVSVENGVLTIKYTDTRKWYEHIGIFWKKESVTLYLPESEYDSLLVKGHTGSVQIPDGFLFQSIDVSLSTGHVSCSADVTDLLKLTTSTGHIRISGITAGSMDLKVSTGDVSVRSTTVTDLIAVKVSTGDLNFSGVRCVNLVSNGSTGEAELEDVIATGLLQLERSTGDVELNECDAGKIFIKTDTGDVKGTLLSGKVFITRTDTGRVRVPETTEGGTCAVTTDTGNIRFEIVPY